MATGRREAPSILLGIALIGALSFWYPASVSAASTTILPLVVLLCLATAHLMSRAKGSALDGQPGAVGPTRSTAGGRSASTCRQSDLRSAGRPRPRAPGRDVPSACRGDLEQTRAR
jgi:hypothetical protein